jgi:hypothetical protein
MMEVATRDPLHLDQTNLINTLEVDSIRARERSKLIGKHSKPPKLRSANTQRSTSESHKL